MSAIVSDAAVVEEDIMELNIAAAVAVLPANVEAPLLMVVSSTRTGCAVSRKQSFASGKMLQLLELGPFVVEAGAATTP